MYMVACVYSKTGDASPGGSIEVVIVVMVR